MMMIKMMMSWMLLVLLDPLHDMMETFMMTQTTHGQLLDELITKVAALRSDFTEYRRSFPPPPPLDP